MRHSKIKFFIATILSSTAFNSSAALWGNDFNISNNPSAGGMAGATFANPYDASSAVFGNPATMVKFRSPRTITLGATYANIDYDWSHDGTLTGEAFSATSDTKDFLIPNFSAIGKLADDWVIGGGLQLTAGLGSDFRTSNVLQPGITYLGFGANFAFAKQLSENWSIGATATMGYGLMEIGPVISAGTSYDIGTRGTLGVLYDNDNYSLSLHYTSELGFDFDNAFLTTGTEYADLSIEQASEWVVGFSYRFNENWDWQISGVFKNWSDAAAYQDVWDDQEIISTGVQYSKGAWSFRTGIAFNSDFRKPSTELGSSFSGINSLGFMGNTVPLSPPVVEFLQASVAGSFFDHYVTAGVGYRFNENTVLDMYIGQVLGDEEEYSAMNQTELDIFWLGTGFTFNF